MLLRDIELIVRGGWCQVCVTSLGLECSPFGGLLLRPVLQLQILILFAHILQLVPISLRLDAALLFKSLDHLESLFRLARERHVFKFKSFQALNLLGDYEGRLIFGFVFYD